MENYTRMTNARHINRRYKSFCKIFQAEEWTPEWTLGHVVAMAMAVPRNGRLKAPWLRAGGVDSCRGSSELTCQGKRASTPLWPTVYPVKSQRPQLNEDNPPSPFISSTRSSSDLLAPCPRLAKACGRKVEGVNADRKRFDSYGSLLVMDLPPALKNGWIRCCTG